MLCRNCSHIVCACVLCTDNYSTLSHPRPRLAIIGHEIYCYRMKHSADSPLPSSDKTDSCKLECMESTDISRLWCHRVGVIWKLLRWTARGPLWHLHHRSVDHLCDYIHESNPFLRWMSLGHNYIKKEKEEEERGLYLGIPEPGPWYCAWQSH